MTQDLDSPSGLGRFGPLARELVKLGHKVQVIALHPAWDKLPYKQFCEQGVEVNYVSPMHVRKDGPRKIYYGLGKLLAVSLAATLRLASALASSQADIIQLCKPQPFSCLAVKIARRGRPVFCDCDDYEAATNKFYNHWQQHIVQYFENDVINYASGLTVNTQFTKQRYTNLGFPSQRIVYVPNGVERNRFIISSGKDQLRQQWRLSPNAPVVAYIGTLGLLSHPIDILLDAFVQVVRRLPQARLLLVGGGEDYDKLKHKAKLLGIANYTVFTGRVPPSDVPLYLSLADVTVDPIHDDLIARARSPLKLLESLTMGVPVVTSDVGDRRSLLGDGALGRLVSPGDSNALAKGLLDILQNQDERMAIRREALAQCEDWYWDRLVHDFVQVYDV